MRSGSTPPDKIERSQKMAKTNRKTGTSTVSKRPESHEHSKSTAVVSRPGPSETKHPSERISKASSPTYQQIADRAKEIWRRKGCPAGQDDANWFEAEAQLKREFAAK